VITLVSSALAVLTVAWAGVLVAAPYLPPPVAGPLYLLGSVICHQLADRSFHLDAAQLPVCARCIGIYGGAAAGAVAAIVNPPVRVRNAGLVIAVASIPTAVTLLLEWGRLWSPSNVARALAGATLGLALALVIVDVIRPPGRRPRRLR
jgi:uncharacterized membrane protein